MSASRIRQYILGGTLLLVGIFSYVSMRRSDGIGRESGARKVRILTSEKPSNPESKDEQRAARLAHWKALTANAVSVERREVAAEDNGYFECQELSRLYLEFAKDYSKDELETLREMALGTVPWNQEIIDAMLQDAEAVSAQFQKVLEKPDLQVPSLSGGLPDPLFAGQTSWFLKFVKDIEIEIFRRSGDIPGALEAVLGSLEFTERLRNADGYIIHELVGLDHSGNGRSMLKKVLESGGYELDPLLMEAVAAHLGNDRPPLEVSSTALQMEYATQLEWIAMMVEGTASKGPEPIELEGPDGSIWGDEEFQQAFDRVDLELLSSFLDLQWRDMLREVETFERTPRQSQFLGDENSTLESMSPRQLAEFLAEGLVPIIGKIGQQAVSNSLDQRLTEAWVATERARIDGFEVTSPEVLVPRYLDAVPENPFTGEPLGFDGTFFGTDLGESVRRYK